MEDPYISADQGTATAPFRYRPYHAAVLACNGVRRLSNTSSTKLQRQVGFNLVGFIPRPTLDIACALFIRNSIEHPTFRRRTVSSPEGGARSRDDSHPICFYS